MFSRTTMLSSTRIPTTSESPSIVIWFNVNPANCMGMKVAMSEVGMAIAQIRVPRRLWRKRNTTRIASSDPTMRLVFTSSSDASMNLDWSWEMRNRMLPGRSRSIVASSALTRLITSTVLASVSLVMTMPTLSWPRSFPSSRANQTRVICSRSFVVSCTSATSARVSGRLLLPPRAGTGRWIFRI